MKLHSVAIPEGSVIKLTYAEPGCGGQNVSPDLVWSDAPEETASYAITCYDPDAPTGSGWWHWICFDLPSLMGEVGEGQALEAPVRQWQNDYGYPGYGGPCPPPGPAHRYVFTVHALDVPKLDVEEDATSAICRFTILAHSLDSASFTATFGVD